MARKGGSRRKRVNILTKPVRKKGKISLKSYLSEFKQGDRVALNLEPAIQKGMFHPRFSGRVGTIITKAGACYEVKIKDLEKNKSLIVHPVHLKKM